MARIELGGWRYRERGLPLYRIFLRGHGAILGRQDVEAENDRAAMILAEVLCDACSDMSDFFELWQGFGSFGSAPTCSTLKRKTPWCGTKKRCATANGALLKAGGCCN
jgi:hypothetical protein